MKISQKISIFLIITLAITPLYLGISWLYFLNTPMLKTKQEPVTFVFAQGMSVKKASNTLQEQRLIKHTTFFTALIKFKGVGRNLQAGEYLIEPGITTPVQLVTKMARGDVIHQAFTVIEGWTFSQMIAALNDNPHIKHTIQKLSSAEIMDMIGHSGELPEGRFAPDTYLFNSGVKDIDVLISAYKLMQSRLQSAWANRAQDLPYHCPYQALIVASLIEKETAIEQEKPIIAGVILRRLAKNRLLQVDPTIIYGLGEKYGGKLMKSDLKKDSPYNTYTRKGLPPTPIAMPGYGSIQAALHPLDSTVLYYVAKGDGTHEFSNTFKEHDKAVKKQNRGSRIKD